ncbi:MAG: hypothetical protein HYY93_09390 [Planctomycetes bacterium]|nr:hypothetical protein [Planctomycetota bacterium]
MTPTADGAVTCSVAAGAAEDAGGNANTSSNTASVMYDSLAPSVSGPDPDGDGDGNPESGAAPYTLTLAGAAPAAPGDIYEWDYDGDGVYDSISTTTSSTTVTYTIPGVYSPVLRITNTLLVASTSTVSITVAAPAGGEVPVISTWAASPDVGESGELIAFNGTASGGGTGTITLWEIDFEGDGTIDRSIAGPGPISTTFQYETPGTYNARLRVTDTENLGAEASISVTDPPSVSIVAPVLRVWFVSPRTGEVLWGNSITLHANAAPASIVESVVFKRWDTTVDGAADYTNLNDARWITIATATPPPSSFNVLWNASGVPADSFDLVCVAAGTGGVTASSDAVQTISVTVSANPAVWTIRETVSGNAKARTDAAPSGSDSQHRSLHPTLYESSTTVELPAGALAADTTLTISHLPGNPQGTASGFTFLPGEFQSITLGAGTLSKSATVTIQYPDADNDGIVNGQGVFEADLRIVRFDPILGAWRVIPECTVNTAENFVRGRTPGFSDFGVVGALAPVASGAGGGASDGDAAVAEVGRVESGDSSGGCFAARLGLESSSRVGLLALAICALGLGLWRAVDGSFRVR